MPVTKKQTAVRRLALAGGLLCCLCGLAWSGEGVQTAFDAKGLSSLQYNGVQLLASGAPVVREVVLETERVNDQGLHEFSFERPPVDAPAVAMDEKAGILTYTYAWGTVAFKFISEGSTLTARVRIVNTTKDKSVADFNLQLLTLKFPAAPEKWDKPQVRIWRTLDNLVTITAVYGAEKLVATMNTIDPPVQFGFDKPSDPARTTYPLLMKGGVFEHEPGEHFMHPHGRPHVKPGEALVLEYALRFAPKETPQEQLCADLYQKFQKYWGPVHAWKDRRPIGMLMLQCGDKSKSNPRGWFKKKDLDVSTDAGKAQFREMALKWADSSVKELKATGAQGGIVWNVEGEENPHPITYLGEPRLLKTLAPEMEAVADDLFKKFTDAGLRIGVCIRPSQIYHDAKKGWQHGTGSDGSPERGDQFPEIRKREQAPWWDFYPIVERMNDKIAYCKKRWGCTLFYIDTNGIFEGVGEKHDFKWRLLNGAMWREIQKANPDVLLIPELASDDYSFKASMWASCAVYMELDMKGYGTTGYVRSLLPGSFSLVNVNDGPIEEKKFVLVDSVKQGDILMFRGWFGDSRNKIVRSIYEEAGVSLEPPAP